MSPTEWAFLGATALWNAILLYTATPQGGVFDRRLCCAVCPIACVLYLALGQLALGGGACYGRAALAANDEDTEVAATVPCALFGALFAQSVVQCAVARARPAKGRVAEAAAWQFREGGGLRALYGRAAVFRAFYTGHGVLALNFMRHKVEAAIDGGLERFA